ncbi:regulator of G-protein signaling 16-like [Brienomyrus brachyistius]|uniref:regulator of G-protein signaling 16-like n=1 Tax=Brienomyrus brachyistius TaxID=42636 RepID=UPI0020B31CAA|nr:regulator of G-protein signaling 16-like [Brienomyrus brachyistius]
MCRGHSFLPAVCLERAKEVKVLFSSFLHRAVNPSSLHKTVKLSLPTSDEMKWRESFDKLLSSKNGLAAFQAFLVTEFSEENIAFYLACEDYKSTKSSAKLPEKAKKIFEEFIENDAPREVNIDHETRDITKKNLEQPTLSCFSLAQDKIYTLMEKDSYPRFLKSAAYQQLTGRLANKISQQGEL